ncbi:inactive rhomboid protein 1-like [Amphiura filiformis]|uniref:inactive rhomboid protein 1-like n=1 Tax=Amphiura filiformis TaxID=82378 RepID=UPI003B223446
MTFLVLCFFGGISPIGLTPKAAYLDNVKTFRGTEMVVSVQYPNVWIGPNAAFWIRHGALFAPCLRSDHKINVMLSKQDYQTSDPLGCCEVEARNTAGTTTQLQCYEYTYNVGYWLSIECSLRPAGANNIAHILKPCCYQLTGECKLTTHQHCTFLGGYYHAQGPEHCSKVNCLADICGVGGLSMQADPETPYMPTRPNQWWRLLISPFYHNGILHLILVLIPQLLFAVPIERMAGGVRLFFIYFVSEVTGNLLASLFTPYLPHLGGSAAVCGLISVQSIELAQSWVLVQRPHKLILKLVAILIVFLLSGTLPYLDNFAHLGGFVAGSLAAVIFLPYIVFGQWHSRRRRILLILAIPSLVAVLSMLLLLFYVVQAVDFCTACQYINCIPYTLYLCNSTWYNPQPSV